MGAPKTVLIAWELGGGMGHINRLMSVERELFASGHRPMFALRHTTDTAAVSRLFPGALIVQAPFFRSVPKGPQDKGPLAFDYADILYRCGYESPEVLNPLVLTWQRLFDAAKPALIVCDHSPTTVLAAAGRVPVVHLGSGFATPPSGRPFMVLTASASDGAKERAEQVLRSIQQVQSGLGAPSPKAVCELLGLAENYACCLPELDPYRSIRPEPALGPVEILPQPHPRPEGAFLFGYLAGDFAPVRRVLESLAKAKTPCGIYVRKAPPELGKSLAGSSVKLYDTPQKLPEALMAASAILHHGGLSTAETALALGRPQFLLPRYVEQTLTANAIQKMGCGLNLFQQKTDPGELIGQALNRGAYAKEAAAAASKIAERRTPDVRARIVESCLKHLA
jgi:rhamnosyltransferase subunit B